MLGLLNDIKSNLPNILIDPPKTQICLLPISAEQKINQIEKGELLEVIEMIWNRVEANRIAQNLVKYTEILVIFSSANAFMRSSNAGNGQLVIDAAPTSIWHFI